MMLECREMGCSNAEGIWVMRELKCWNIDTQENSTRDGSEYSFSG